MATCDRLQLTLEYFSVGGGGGGGYTSCYEIIALFLRMVFCEESKDLIEIGTFYLHGALLS